MTRGPILSDHVTLADIRFASAVYAYLDAAYTGELPPMKVRLAKDEASRLLRESWGRAKIVGRWDGEQLTLQASEPDGAAA